MRASGEVAAGGVGVLEVDPTGHRLHYVRRLHEAAGHERCVVFVPAGFGDAEEYSHLGAARTAASTVDGDETSRDRALTDAVDQAVARGLDRLVIPDADHYLVPLLRLLARRPRLRLRFRLLLMRTPTVGGPGPVTPALLLKPLLVRVVRCFPQVRVHFLTDALGVVTARRGYGGVRGVRDPVSIDGDQPSVSLHWLPDPGPDGLLVGLFGVVSPRKNLPLLVQAARAESRTTIVVAGRVWPEVAHYLDTDPDALALTADGRLAVVDRLLEADEFGAALAAVDVAAVLHDNDAPSGILAEACVRGTPVIVPAGAWLARVVATTGIGRATSLSVEGVVEALRAVRTHRAEFTTATEAARGRIGADHFTSTLLA